MADLVFTIKASLGGAAWSQQHGTGSFVPLHGTEVVLHPGPAIHLIGAVGSDGFTLLVALATLATLDDQDRLVVAGGQERIRGVLGWGREKMTRVFRELADIGYVTREQDFTVDGRKGRFQRTHLILNPTLYRPSRDLFTGTESNADGKPVSGPTGARSNGGGKPGTVDIAPGRNADGFSATGEAPTMDDDDELSSSSSSLIHTLAVLGFSDAHEVVRTTDRADLIAKLSFLKANLASISNPGGYLRKMLVSGTPAPDGTIPDGGLRSVLAAAIAPSAPPESTAPPPAPERHLADDEPDDESDIDIEALHARLAALPADIQHRINTRLTDAVNRMPRTLRDIPAAAAAVRADKLRQILDESTMVEP